MTGADEAGAGSAAKDGAAGTRVVRTRWGVVSVVIFASVIVGYAVGKVPPTIGLVSDEFGLDKVTAGWLASIFFAYGAGLGVLTGMTGARIGARALLLTGVLVLVLSGIAGALATSAAMLLAVRVFEGISFAAMVTAAPKITVDVSRPEDRNLTLGIWSGYMPGGMALAMIVAPFLAEPLGWRSLWWLMAGVSLIATVLAVVGMSRRRWPEQPRPDPDAGFDWAGVRATLPVGALWLYGGAFLLFTIQWFAIAAWLPTFLIETQGRGPMGAALFSALVVGMNVTGNLIGGWLMHHGVPRFALVGAANVIMGVTGLLILAGFVPDDAKIPLAIVFSGGSGILPAAAYAGAAAHVPKPELGAMANGFMAQGAAIGMLLGPPLMAVVVGGLGSWEAAWWCMLICPAIGLAITTGLFGIERRRP
ncbi:MAG: MFS transporter [Rhodospirillales bacterium]|nr:MFS transporter [Rhodospirillales bacterium]